MRWFDYYLICFLIVFILFLDTTATCPCIYLIGSKGIPLEIIVSPQTSLELKEKFSSAWNRHCIAINAVAAKPSSSGGAGDVQKQESSSFPGISVTAQALLNANEAVRVAENDVNQENLSLEEKMARAERLVAAKRKQKLAEEAEVVFLFYYFYLFMFKYMFFMSYYYL